MSDPAMKLVTGLFWGLAGMTAFRIMIGIIACVMAYGALYSDWVLVIAAKTGLSGFPYHSPAWEKVLWVFYFVGKRLSLFMT
ncbi:hypothetical protein LZ30DRAFT_736318 [Colletotrichum cereale]|nr:hypothetical protein LZ30DRAFT_736318 [Colletotrichum cereale]